MKYLHLKCELLVKVEDEDAAVYLESEGDALEALTTCDDAPIEVRVIEDGELFVRTNPSVVVKDWTRPAESR